MKENEPKVKDSWKYFLKHQVDIDPLKPKIRWGLPVECFEIYDRLVSLEAKIEVMENILKWSSLDAHSRLVLKKLVANRKAELEELVKVHSLY